jgi:hypothetical protein
VTDSGITTAIAIYGAFIASIGGLWNIYQWWSRGPKLVGHTGYNMQIIGDPRRSEDDSYVTITIANRGSAATEITNLCLLGYDTQISFWRGRPSYQAVVMHARPGYSLPDTLQVGGEWRSMALQDEKFKELSRAKILCFGVFHSFSSKPYRVKIGPIVSTKKIQ